MSAVSLCALTIARRIDFAAPRWVGESNRLPHGGRGRRFEMGMGNPGGSRVARGSMLIRSDI